MSYLARGPVGTTGVDSMSPRAIPVSAGSVSITTPQAAP